MKSSPRHAPPWGPAFCDHGPPCRQSAVGCPRGSAAACTALPGHPPWSPFFTHGLLGVSSHWAAASRFLRHRSVGKTSANGLSVPWLRIPGPASSRKPGLPPAPAAAISPDDAHSKCFGAVARNQALVHTPVSDFHMCCVAL